MSAVFMASYVVLWILVLLLAFQPRRAAPQKGGATHVLPEEDHGLPKGAVFPVLRLKSMNGTVVDLCQPRGTIALFTSPKCPACFRLYPELAPYLGAHPEVRIVDFMIGDESEVKGVIPQIRIDIPVVLISPKQTDDFMTKITPFAYFLSPEGRVLAKGVVNRQEDLVYLGSTPTKVITVPKNGSTEPQTGVGH